MLPEVLLRALWLFLPAFVANPTAVLWGGGRPVDMGRVWRDGRRILGDGKTWRGLAGGTLSGLTIGLLQGLVALKVAPDLLAFGSPLEAILVPFLLALGALLGDVAAAFAKRRWGLERGARAPGLDQYDFVAGALVLTALIRPAWVLGNYVVGEVIWGLLLLLLVTPLLHRGVNILGYRLGKKEVPW